MPRSASTGVYTPPSNSFNPAVTDTTISSAAWNATAADFVAAFAHAPSSTRALYPTTGQVQDNAFLWGGTAGGTADAITINLTPAITAYVQGQRIQFRAGAAGNATTTPTLAVNGLAATIITRSDGIALRADDIPANALIDVQYVGTNWRIVGVAPSQARLNGGTAVVTSGVDIALVQESERFQGVTMTAEFLAVQMPNALTLTPGQNLFTIANRGTRAFAIRSAAPNLFADPPFNNPVAWTAGTGWVVSGGFATKTGGTQSDVTQAIATTANVVYTVTYSISTISAGTVAPVLTGGGATVVGPTASAPGTYTVQLTSNGNLNAGFRGDASFVGAIDNVIIRRAAPPLITALLPGGSANLSLLSNDTIEGVWIADGTGLVPCFDVANATLPSTLTEVQRVTCRLTDVLSLHFACNASGHPFVFAVNHGVAPATIGTAALIVASNQDVAECLRINDTKAVVILGNGAVYNVTVSGTTVTVSASASTALFGGTTLEMPRAVLIGANNDLLVLAGGSGGGAFAVDCSGTNPVAGSSASLGIGTAADGYAMFPVTTSRVVLFFFNGGAAPWALNAVILSVSGTTVTVGTAATISDAANTTFVNNPAVARHSATLYTCAYYQATGTNVRAVALTVSGTTATFGTPVTVETVATIEEKVSGDDDSSSSSSASRYFQNLYPISTTQAVLTYHVSGSGSRHVVLTNAAGVVTAGAITYGLWTGLVGCNLSQRADAFVIGNAATAVASFAAVTITGTTLSLGQAIGLSANGISTAKEGRFSLSGGWSGVGLSASPNSGRFVLLRHTGGGGLSGGMVFTLPNNGWLPASGVVPTELTPNKVAISSISLSQSGTTTGSVRLNILEFAA